MLTTPLPDADETRDNTTFAAILRACSRPGTIETLPEPGPLCVARALLDRECRAFAEDAGLAREIALTGAAMTAASQADHVFMALDTAERLAIFAQLHRGSQLYPDEGATVILPATIGTGATLRLTGPGIKSHTDIAIGGVHPGLWAARARLNRYPEGVEMLLVDGSRLLALPRSTSVTEL